MDLVVRSPAGTSTGASAIPALRGHYLYADYCAGFVRSFRYAGGGAIDRQDRLALGGGANPTSFGEDSRGEVYLLTQGGAVYRLISH